MALALRDLETPSTLSRADHPNDYAAAQCTEIVNQLRKDFADRNALYADIDAVVFGDLPVWIPDAYRKTALEVHSPLAIHIVNTVTAALSINPVTYTFRPTGFGQSANENATLRERFFEASWERQMEEARRRLDRLFIASLVTKGEGILKTVERTKRAWADYDVYSKRLQKALESDPEYKGFDSHARDHLYDRQTEEYKLQAPYPIATTDVPPETFLYQKTEDGFTYTCEVKQVPYLETLTRYGASLDSKGRVLSKEQFDPHAMGLSVPESLWGQVMGKRRTLTMVEAYDCYGYCTCLLIGPGQSASGNGNLANGTVVKRFRHGYLTPLGTLRGPYFHALGITTASRLPHRAGLGVLFGFLRLFPLLNSLMTSQGNAAFMTGFPAFKRTVPPGTIPGLPGPAPFGNDGVQGEAAEERIQPGDVYPYDIGPLEMPRSGPEMDKTIGMVRQFLELALPSIVQGVVSGDESGYALNQAQHLARLAWDPIVGNAEICHGERVGFESWMIANRVGEKVYAWGEAPPKRSGGRVYTSRTRAASWQGIEPDDLGSIHKYKARLDPQTPSNEIIETRAVLEQMKGKLITYEDGVERLGNNPDEVEKSWLLVEMKQDPVIKGKLRERTLQKLGLMDQQAIAAAGGPGMPPGMGGLLGAPGGLPDVYQPGQNGVPLTPTPGGAITGMGPPGSVAGMPSVQSAPANALPLPGQG